jgi:hypothetical protein
LDYVRIRGAFCGIPMMRKFSPATGVLYRCTTQRFAIIHAISPHGTFAKFCDRIAFMIRLPQKATAPRRFRREAVNFFTKRRGD